MMPRIIPFLCVLLVALVAAPPDVWAQQREDLPEEVQRELERRGLTVECVEIMDDTDAEAAYAEFIPVIECPQRSRPLYWPFDMADLYRYLP